MIKLNMRFPAHGIFFFTTMERKVICYDCEDSHDIPKGELLLKKIIQGSSGRFTDTRCLKAAEKYLKTEILKSAVYYQKQIDKYHKGE